MINYLIYMDDIKLFVENEKEPETLKHAMRIYSQDIGMEFGRERCSMPVMKSGKRHLTDGMELPNQNRIERSKTYKYWDILEADSIKQLEMKKKTLRNNISGEPESYSRQNYVAETLPNE